MKIIKWIIIGIVIVILGFVAYIGWEFVIWPDSSYRFDIEYPDDGTRIACVGDSITEGSSARDITKYSYPVQLSLLLGDEYVVGNFGVSGATAINGGLRPYSSLNAFNYSQEFEPDIVLIMLGTNDSKVEMWDRESYKQDYKDLIKKYMDMQNSPRIVVILPIPAYSTEFNIQPSIIKDEIIPDVKEICIELEIECIDMNSQFMEKKELLNDDGIHPNREGYEYMANVLFDLIDWN